MSKVGDISSHTCSVTFNHLRMTIVRSCELFLITLCCYTGPIEGNIRAPIHRPAPLFTEQGKSQEILVTGIKVVDLLAPYAKGGKIGLFGGAGVGKTVSFGTCTTTVRNPLT